MWPTAHQRVGSARVERVAGRRRVRLAASGSPRPSTAASTVQPASARSPANPTSTVRSSVPVARSSARPPIAWMSARWTGARRVQEHRAGDPTVPPLVLVLDVGRVGPLHDPERERVRPGPQTVGHVELGGEVRVLADPDVAPLSVTIRTLSAAPTWSTIRRPAQPAGARRSARRRRSGSLGDLGRLARERHLDVGVVRQVAGVLHRPAARDLDVAPGVGGRPRPAGEQLEAPRAVELEPVGVRHGVHRQAAEARQFRVGPGVAHEQDCRMEAPAVPPRGKANHPRPIAATTARTAAGRRPRPCQPRRRGARRRRWR